MSLPGGTAVQDTIVNRFKVIDTDAHMVEPPDLWTSRMSTKWGDLVPSVRWDDDAKEEAWFVGDHRLGPVAAAAQAGWHEYPPSHPPRWEDADPHTWDARLRLQRMDEYGVWAQVLYPNVALFNPATKKADRVGSKTLQDGRKVRIFKANDEQVDA